MADDTKFTQEDIDKAVKAAVDKVQESIERLETKNEELVGEVRKYKAEARAASEITPETLQAAEERADKAEAKAADLDKQVKAITKERDTAVKTLETEQGFTQRLLIQDGLKTALIANGVKDEDFIDSLTAKFAAGAKVVQEGDARKAVYGDKPLGDFIKEWAGSDVGKKFVSAPANGGGGSPGGKGAQSGKTMARSAFDGLPHGERAQFVSEGGKVVDQAA